MEERDLFALLCSDPPHQTSPFLALARDWDEYRWEQLHLRSLQVLSTMAVEDFTT